MPVKEGCERKNRGSPTFNGSINDDPVVVGPDSQVLFEDPVTSKEGSIIIRSHASDITKRSDGIFEASIDSPWGQALQGKKVGDTFTVKTPRGDKLTKKVKKIKKARPVPYERGSRA